MKMIFILMQIKLILTAKVLYLASFWKKGVYDLWLYEKFGQICSFLQTAMAAV